MGLSLALSDSAGMPTSHFPAAVAPMGRRAQRVMLALRNGVPLRVSHCNSRAEVPPDDH